MSYVDKILQDEIVIAPYCGRPLKETASPTPIALQKSSISS